MRKQLGWFLLIGLLFMSCKALLNSLSFDRETFDRERQLWLEQDLQNYSFQHQVQKHGVYSRIGRERIILGRRNCYKRRGFIQFFQFKP